MDEVIKRRVIGTSVLVGVGILIPFLLIHLAQPGTPPSGESVRVYEITPGGQARPVSGRSADTENRNGAERQRQSMPADARDAATAGQGAEPADTRTEAEASSDAQASGNGETGAAHETQRPAPARAANTPEPAHTSRPRPESESAADGPHWVVQVGSFVEEGNAIDLMRQLADDYPAFYHGSEVEGKVHYRVRIGPYADADKAGQVAEALHAKGRSAQVLRAD